jgi:hypothetical protein
MATAVTIYDEETVGGTKRSFVLSLASERLTVRDLILRRVTHEVEEYNKTRTEHYAGLIQPTGAEVTLNGFHVRERRALDAGQQSEKALEAFGRNGFLLLVNNKQLTELDEQVVVTPGTQVRFVKLIPLVGG